MNNQVVTQKTELKEKFLIKPNPKFNILPSEGITLLENTPVSVSYQRVEHATGGGQTVSFQTRIGESFFLDRGLIVQMEIPVTLKLLTPAAATITASNYLASAGNFNGIALRQNGLIAGMENIELTLNENVVTNVTQIAKAFEMTSEYYDLGTMSKFMPASQPDRFTDYIYYGGSGPKILNTVSEVGDKMQIAINPINEENVFTGGYSNTYNSRKVAFSFVSSPDLSTINVKTTVWSYIPFSIFGLSNSPFSLYGINTLTLNIGLKANFVREIFVTQGLTIPSIDFNYSVNQASTHKSTLLYKMYKAPDYITAAMIDRATGSIKPYRIGHTSMHFEPIMTQTTAGGETNLSTGQISVGVIPKSVYLSVHAVKDQSAPWITPNFKGRIKQIVAQVGSAEVTIGPSAIRLFDLARSNGLAKDYESAMYTNGYVMKIDMTKDVSVGSALIGANTPLTLNFQVLFEDLTGILATKYELRCVLAFAGQIQFKDRQFTPLKSLVLSSTNFSVENQAAMLYGELTPEIMTIGAGFFGDLWSGVKNLAKKGFNWVKENPEEAIGLVRKGVKLATGAGHVPYTQTYAVGGNNVIGGADTLILGAGDMGDDIFK